MKTCDVENVKCCPTGYIDGCILLGNELFYTYVSWLNPGSMRICQNRISADRERKQFIRVQTRVEPGFARQREHIAYRPQTQVEFKWSIIIALIQQHL